MNWVKKSLIVVAALFVIGLTSYYETLIRFYQGYQILKSGREKAKYYELDQQNFEDITQKLIEDERVPLNLKQPLIQGARRIVIFKYPSGSHEVAGYLSYLTKGTYPTLLFLRDGNGFSEIMRPNNPFSFLEGYNVVGTLYRGNIYGGVDEWGGEDVYDVENLMKFFPQLEKHTGVKISPPYTLLGVSRGAMEMFAALSRLRYVQERVTHAVSVSGNIDLQVTMDKRPEMRYLFREKFKQSGKVNFEAWIRERDPVLNASLLPKSLKVLLVYGLADNRVFLEEQLNLQRALEAQGISVELVTIPGAPHDLEGHFQEFEESLKIFMSP